jgi:hypothetical protein
MSKCRITNCKEVGSTFCSCHSRFLCSDHLIAHEDYGKSFAMLARELKKAGKS